MKALVTDDSAFMRNMMVEILEDMGFDEVYEADDGSVAIEKVKEENDIDLVTLDVVMEDVGGVDALKQIKDENSDIHCIMVSSVGQDQMIEEAKENGAEYFIDKPFEEDDVKDTITDVVA